MALWGVGINALLAFIGFYPLIEFWIFATICGQVNVEGKVLMKLLSPRQAETKYGRVRGRLVEFPNRHLKPVEAYFGLQYASLLNGSLRFMPPTSPTEKWSGVRVALKHRPVCPQRIVEESELMKNYPKVVAEQLSRLTPFVRKQTEDCLTLNLYVPKPDVNQTEGVENLAVMVFIQGEAFDSGTGNAYDGSVLASYGNVIVVTLNYRLGVLGFLSVGSGVAPGNYALLDLTAALHWLRQNIESFGGNPNSITIFGHGYGAALVSDLLVSPMSRDGELFQRAIIQSGSALSPWAISTDPVKCTLDLASNVGCTDGLDNVTSLIMCLRNRTLWELLNSVSNPPKYHTCFGPSVNPLSGALPRQIESLLADPMYNSPVKLMFGVTKHEAIRYLKESDVEGKMSELRKNQIMRTFVHNLFSYQKQRLYEILDHDYTDWESSLERRSRRDNTLELLSDGLYVAPLMKLGEYHSKKSDTYFYSFSYSSRAETIPHWSGSIHGEELPYVFGAPLVDGLSPFKSEYSKSEKMLSEAVMTYWTNFARTGDPNLPSRQSSLHGGNVKNRFVSLQWPKFQATSQHYLHIGKRPKVAHHYRGRKIALWLELIPNLHRPDSLNPNDDELRNINNLSTFDEPEKLVNLKDILPFTITTSTTTEAPVTNATLSAILNDRPKGTSVEGLSPEEAADESAQQTNKSRAASSPLSDTANAMPLSITISIGCSLLLLNVLIFIGIYFQRHKIKKMYKPSSKQSDDIKFRAKSDIKDGKSEFETINLLPKTESEHIPVKYKSKETVINDSAVPNKIVVTSFECSEPRQYAHVSDSGAMHNIDGQNSRRLGRAQYSHR